MFRKTPRLFLYHQNKLTFAVRNDGRTRLRIELLVFRGYFWGWAFVPIFKKGERKRLVRSARRGIFLDGVLFLSAKRKFSVQRGVQGRLSRLLTLFFVFNYLYYTIIFWVCKVNYCGFGVFFTQRCPFGVGWRRLQNPPTLPALSDCRPKERRKLRRKCCSFCSSPWL